MSGSATLVASVPSSITSRTSPTTTRYTHNVDAFRKQDAHDDGSVHGRLQDQAYYPHPDARIPSYESRAADTLATFNTAIGASESGNSSPRSDH
jgi:3-hydroxy-3-methylglutaryl CoA synthase